MTTLTIGSQRVQFDNGRTQPPPITLPVISLPPDNTELEIQEAAARVAERKIVRAGLDAWQAIGRADSFESWKVIGAALAVGKAHALKVSGAKQAWGSSYSRAFCDWMHRHHFDTMPKSVRSVAIELHENCAAIEQWRTTLSEKDRRGLKHPLSNVRRWRAATQHNGKAPQDYKREARAAARRLYHCLAALPKDEAALIWQSVQAEIIALLI